MRSSLQDKVLGKEEAESSTAIVMPILSSAASASLQHRKYKNVPSQIPFRLVDFVISGKLKANSFLEIKVEESIMPSPPFEIASSAAASPRKKFLSVNTKKTSKIIA